MKVYPIETPAAGERVIAVDPVMKPDVEEGWRRRLNLYTGRSLSDVALETEQIGRAGRLAFHGQMVAPGVVSGLEVALQPGFPGRRGGDLLHVGSGFGITASGEDVVLPKPLVVDVASLNVPVPEMSVDPASPREDVGSSDTWMGRVRCWDRPPCRWLCSWTRLGELIERRARLPRAAILVLQPVVVGDAGGFNPGDPCERDIENDAFDDWQFVDGCRLVLYVLSDEWMPVCGEDQWRNHLVYKIFRYESKKGSKALPWEEFGVPIGLVGFDANGGVLFVDRFSVVRAGGKPPSRTGLFPSVGSPFLWQARMLQFLEQMAETEMEMGRFGPPRISRWFRYLPPAGLLPRDAFDPRSGENGFFPPWWRVHARPAPLEQLDAALEASASLHPLDLFIRQRVEILIPVPQTLYDPALLMEETPDPEFAEAIAEFSDRLGMALKRREDVREKRRVIVQAITGEAPEHPVPDPFALEGEIVSDQTPDPPEDDYGTRTADPPEDDYGTGTADVLEATLFINLKTRLEGKTWLTDDLDEGLESFIRLLEKKVKQADDKIDAGFLRAQVDIYRVRQLMLGSTAASRLSTSPALASIAKGESALTMSMDLQNFIQGLKESKGEKGGGEGGGGDVRPPIIRSAPGAPSARDPYAASRAGTSPHDPGIASHGMKAPTWDASAVRPALDAPIVTEASMTYAPLITTPLAVSLKAPIVGKAYNFRNITVADRLEEPAAGEAKNFCVATKYETVREMSELEIDVDDLEVPGFYKYKDDVLQTERVEYDNNDIAKIKIMPKATVENFADITLNGLAAEILQDKHDLAPPNSDEGGFFSAGIRAIDNSIAILRLVEGRIQAYKSAIVDCKETLTALNGFRADAESRLQAIAVELAEARHDLAVGRALLAEETDRVNKTNKRREAILDEHVPFLAFRRPRNSDNLSNVPIRRIDPGPAESPIPECLAANIVIPDELRDMVDLLREAPVKWFAAAPGILFKLDRLELLTNVIANARPRAIDMVEGLSKAITVTTGVMSQSIGKVFTARREVVSQYRMAFAQFDAAALNGQSWRQCYETAVNLLSIGDLLQADNGRSDVSRRASKEIDDMVKIAACLYVRFSETTPAIRLEWAERLGQYDNPVNLRNLSSLPRWAEIDIRERREMQALADWLYQRMNPETPEAIHMIHDLVRVCILLASHAPVKRIIAGHMAEETASVSVGSRVTLEADVSQLTIDMPVAVFKGEKLAARAVVEDLTAAHASARVLKVMEQETVTLEKANTTIRFGVGAIA